MMLRIPIGTEDFKDIRKQFYFVDKSSFISEFFRRRAAVTLITRPRRFGCCCNAGAGNAPRRIPDAQEF